MSSAQISDIVNFRRIDAMLDTAGQPSEEELAAAARDGIEVVINLALHDDPRYSLRDERGTVNALGMRYVHIPVKFDSPTEQDLLAFFDAMQVNAGKRILVHCAANKRVTAFLGLYRVIRQRCDREVAFAPMNTVWQPNEHWAPFIRAMLEKHTA
jgi:protein tyrosine phosphatase (PTP) superfamily phosphohydrolase (DUF442 family)